MSINFYTPTLLALRLSDEPELEEGETAPLKLECAPIDDLINPETYVVKFYSSMAMNGFGVVAEIISGHLARYFGIAIPEFALIEISDAFAQSTRSNFHVSDRILTSIGRNVHSHNFGSKLITLDIKSPMSIQVPTAEQLEMAEKIFAFDALIYNADRSSEWPNVFTNHSSFIAYDHEKAFNFLFNGKAQPPKKIDFCTLTGDMFLPKHVFRQLLHDRQLTFANFIDMLEQLDDVIIKDILSQVPYRLSKEHAKEIDAISEYLTTVRKKSSEFRYGVMRVLA